MCVQRQTGTIVGRGETWLTCSPRWLWSMRYTRAWCRTQVPFSSVLAVLSLFYWHVKKMRRWISGSIEVNIFWKFHWKLQTWNPWEIVVFVVVANIEGDQIEWTIVGVGLLSCVRVSVSRRKSVEMRECDVVVLCTFDEDVVFSDEVSGHGMHPGSWDRKVRTRDR